MTSRIFIGLDLPLNVKTDLMQIRDEIYGESGSIKWESEDKLHITVKFLGDVGDNLTNLIFQRLENLNFAKIKSKFDKFAFFKKDGLLKILYASLTSNKNVDKFYEIIEDECELLGFKRERRKFHPHVTLLRLKGKEDLNRLINFNNLLIDYPDFSISSFSIYKSELKPTGSEYIKLKSFNFE